jgi:hypothetical protein
VHSSWEASSLSYDTTTAACCSTAHLFGICLLVQQTTRLLGTGMTLGLLTRILQAVKRGAKGT